MSKTILAQVDGFTPIIDDVLESVGLSAAAVFGRVWRYCQMENGVCYASLKTIGEGLGLSKPTIIKYLDLLVEHGYLEDTTPGLSGIPHVYRDTGKAGMRLNLTAETGKKSLPVATGKKSLPGESKIFTGTSKESLPEDSTKRESKTPPVVYPEQTETLTVTGRRTDAKVKGDLLDGMLFGLSMSQKLDIDSWLPPDLADLARPLCSVLGIEPPADKTGRNRWIKELGNWRTNSRTAEQVRNVSTYMLQKRLTATGPWSLSGMLSDPQIAKGSKPLPDGYRPGIDPNPATGFVDFVPGVSQL